jgi:hypothetical protein
MCSYQIYCSVQQVHPDCQPAQTLKMEIEEDFVEAGVTVAMIGLGLGIAAFLIARR